jgi:hypothetical protein
MTFIGWGANDWTADHKRAINANREIAQAIHDPCSFILFHSLNNERRFRSDVERKEMAARRKVRAELNALERTTRAT